LESIGKLLEDTLMLYEKKEYDQAEKFVDVLLNANPQFHRGWFLKGVILEETERKDEAEKCYARAGSLFNMWFRLALQLKDSDPIRSLAYFDRVLELDRTFSTAWFYKGLVHEKLGDFTNAKICFGKLSPGRELFSRVAVPAGFLLLLLISGGILISRGEKILSFFVVLSALVCFFWLKRDAGTALIMYRKKKQYAPYSGKG
jgi:tetratricopeptide (TPR) repeat protein